MEKKLCRNIYDICNDLIYHGRHFSSSRDAVVLKKAVAEILKLTKPSDYAETLDCGCTVTKGFRCPWHNQP